MAAMAREVPYAEVVCTDAHTEYFMAEMTPRVFKAFQTEGHALYQAELVQILGRKKGNKKVEPTSRATKETRAAARKPAASKSDAKTKAKAEPKAAGAAKFNKQKLLAELQKLNEDAEEDDEDVGPEDEDDDASSDPDADE